MKGDETNTTSSGGSLRCVEEMSTLFMSDHQLRIFPKLLHSATEVK